MTRPVRLAALLALAVVCTATARAAALPEAAQALWPGVALQLRQVPLSATQAAKARELSGRPCKAGAVEFYEGPKGQVLVLDNVIGKHFPIDYALAVDAQGRVQAFEVLKYREVYGGQVQREAWRKGFQGRQLDADLALGKGIDVISGATLSARHLTDEVRLWLAILKVLREA